MSALRSITNLSLPSSVAVDQFKTLMSPSFFPLKYKSSTGRIGQPITLPWNVIVNEVVLALKLSTKSKYVCPEVTGKRLAHPSKTSGAVPSVGPVPVELNPAKLAIENEHLTGRVDGGQVEFGPQRAKS